MTAETESATQSDSRDENEAGPYTRWVQNSIKNPGRTYRSMFYIVTIFFLVTTLFPFYWLLVLSLTPSNALSNIGLAPNGFNPEAFVRIFEVIPFQIYLFNSLVIALSTTAIVLVLASLTGYVFGRIDFRGRNACMLLVLMISYFPGVAFLLPLFRLFTGNVEVFGIHSPFLFNTPFAIIFPTGALFMPLSIFILTTFYGQIPDGLEDAARVEGATKLGALVRVIIPLSAPGVATAGILTFISVYNEFFFSYLMTNGEAKNWAPIVWGLLGYQTQYTASYNLMAAASIVGVLPVAILVIIAQERIVSGLTSGALKE